MTCGLRPLLMSADQDQYNELAYYTLSHGDLSFIHQNVVDAFTAQHADENTKPIGVVFALVGLCLSVEKNFTGRQVQLMHMRLGRKRKQWPRLPLPSKRGDITASHVLAAPPGKARDEMIHAWCASVWQAWKECRPQILALLKKELDIG
ncbi:MAG TPA: DUF5946 family protein [Candidatus Angelobacter sp.]